MKLLILIVLFSPIFILAQNNFAKNHKSPEYTEEFIKGKVDVSGHGFFDCLRRIGISEKELLSCKGQKWLSVGEGKSDFIAQVSKRGIDGHALDAVIKNPHAPERSHLGLAQSLPFKDGEFDRVISVWLIDYFFSSKVFNDPDGGKKALQEMVRVAKVGGEIRINPVEQAQLFTLLDAMKADGKIRYETLPYYKGTFATKQKQREFEITPIAETVGSVKITKLK